MCVCVSVSVNVRHTHTHIICKAFFFCILFDTTEKEKGICLHFAFAPVSPPPFPRFEVVTPGSHPKRRRRFRKYTSQGEIRIDGIMPPPPPPPPPSNTHTHTHTHTIHLFSPYYHEEKKQNCKPPPTSITTILLSLTNMLAAEAASLLTNDLL